MYRNRLTLFLLGLLSVAYGITTAYSARMPSVAISDAVCFFWNGSQNHSIPSFCVGPDDAFTERAGSDRVMITVAKPVFNEIFKLCDKAPQRSFQQEEGYNAMNIGMDYISGRPTNETMFKVINLLLKDAENRKIPPSDVVIMTRDELKPYIL